MPRLLSSRRVLSVAVGLLGVLAVVVPALAADTGESLSNVRDATAAFHSPAAAIADGYELFTDAADIACIEQPGVGAMGIHYVKGAPGCLGCNP